jgi:hypothetical protein
VREAVLNYRVLNPDGNVGGSVRVEEPPPGTTVDLSATLGTITSDNRYIPIGSRFTYEWQITDRDGVTYTTELREFTFLDGRFNWSEHTEGDVTVFWYASQEQAMAALRATREAIEDVSALLEVSMPYPVRVVVWQRSADGQLAQRPRGLTFDSNVITGGSRVGADLLHIYDPLGNFVDVARHEAAHLVTKVAGDGPFTRIPSWLDEGVAVYAQNDPGIGYRQGVDSAIRNDSTLRIRTLTSPTNNPALVNTFYGQSWHVVNFMLETWGQEPLAELFRVVKAGSTTDQAMLEVYGVDQDGLYNLWRESVGLPQLEFEATGASAAVPAAEATRPPLSIPTSVAGGQRATPAAGEPSAPQEGVTAAGSGGGQPTTAIIVGLVTVLLAGGLGGLGLKMMRSK